MGVGLALGAVALAIATVAGAAPAPEGPAAPPDAAPDGTTEPAPAPMGPPPPTGPPPPAGPDGAEVPSVVPELVSPAAEAVALTWEAPAECPDLVAVRRVLSGYLGDGPSPEAGAAVQASARVTRRGAEYQLVLRMQTTSGESVRKTTASDCAVIVDATAVIVAIAVDPATVLGRGDAAPSEPEPSEPEPSEPEVATTGSEVASSASEADPREAEAAPFVAETPAPAAPPPEPPVRFGVRVAGGVDLGVLPGLAGGLRLVGAAIVRGRSARPLVFGRTWRAELSGDFWFPRTAVVQEGIGGRVSLWSVGARGCWVSEIVRARLGFPLCAGLESGAMRGDPVGDRIVGPTDARRFWLAADGSAGLAWAPRRFIALVLQAELVVPIVRAGFRVGDLEVHRAGPVAGRALVGIEARLP